MSDIADQQEINRLNALVERLLKERDEANSRSESRGKILIRTRNRLVNIKDAVESDEDRAFFGSTNDADEFFEIVERLDAFKWDRILAEGKADNPLNNALARAEAAEAQVAALTKALEKIGKSDYERSGRHRYGGSKNDTCDHDNAYWDECFECCSSFARKALEASR